MRWWFVIFLSSFTLGCANDDASLNVESTPIVESEHNVSSSDDFPSPETTYKLLHYKEVGKRKGYALKNTAFKAEVDDWLDSYPEATLEEDILFALRLSADKISFTTEKCSTNPNKVFDEGETHCVGYSAFFHTTLTYLIDHRGNSERYRTHQLIGEIDVLGTDLHQMFDDPFFKDHDFNVIENLESGDRVYVDPSLFDYMGVTWIKGTSLE